MDLLQGPATDNNFLLNGPKNKCFKKLSRMGHSFFTLKENCFGQHAQQNNIDIIQQYINSGVETPYKEL